MQACFYELLTPAVKVLNERELFIYLYLCVCSTLGKHILFCWNPVKFLGVLCNQLSGCFFLALLCINSTLSLTMFFRKVQIYTM